MYYIPEKIDEIERRNANKRAEEFDEIISVYPFIVFHKAVQLIMAWIARYG